MPLYLSTFANSGRRQLQLIGAGLSDYLDAIIQPGFEDAAIGEIGGYLAEQRNNWDVCDLHELRDTSVLRRASIIAQCADEIVIQNVCPALALPVSVDELKYRVPAATLRRLSRYRRKLGRSSRVNIEVPDHENFHRLFDAFVNLHTARWNSRGESGAIADSATALFHKTAAEGFLRKGILRLYLMSIEGRPAAALYCVSCHRRTYGYLSGFAPEFERLSPGTVLLGHAIEEAVREGSAVFDFMRGAEAYKYVWGARNFFNYHRRIHSAEN
ncbi:MAG: GNAT family N-acetyltransferase [Candidatus Binataceae bacterium]